MLNIPNPTTETKTTENGTYIKTIWTVGDHTLTHVTKEGDNTLDRWMADKLDRDAPHVYENTPWGQEGKVPATYAVNWSALGDKTPTEARAYAARLMLAASTAETFAKIHNDHTAK